MEKAKEAFIWVISILEKHEIPFEITGGLAAKVYGSEQPLNDIDIDILEKDFPGILSDVKRYIVYGPAHFVDERWDCFLMTLNYKGQEIDISAGDTIKICDVRTGKWKPMPANFSKSVKKEVFGITVPVINKKDLVEYKSMLEGEHQKEDIKAVLESNK